MSEPIENVEGAVAELGALPMPAGPVSSERDRLRAAFVAALETAHETHPCPVTGRPYWTGCVHPDGRVGSCHSGRRADAVLAVRDVELERLRSRVAELEAERHVTNAALADVTEALRAAQAPTVQEKRDPRGCSACGSLPETWCPDCAACEQGCFGGFDGNSCSHSKAKWGGTQ